MCPTPKAILGQTLLVPNHLWDPNSLHHLKRLSKHRLEGLRFRLVDAKDELLYPLAKDIAAMLCGMDKPIYTPRKDRGDLVIVKNSSHVRLPGAEWDRKYYFSHSGYPGGSRVHYAKDMWERDPTYIIYRAVRDHIPKNKMKVQRMEKLYIFPEEDHAFKDFDLVPFVPLPRKLRDRGLGWPMPAGFTPLNPERYQFRVMTAQHLRKNRKPDVGFKDLLTKEEQQLLAATEEQQKKEEEARLEEERKAKEQRKQERLQAKQQQQQSEEQKQP